MDSSLSINNGIVETKDVVKEVTAHLLSLNRVFDFESDFQPMKVLILFDSKVSMSVAVQKFKYCIENIIKETEKNLEIFSLMKISF